MTFLSVVIMNFFDLKDSCVLLPFVFVTFDTASYLV